MTVGPGSGPVAVGPRLRRFLHHLRTEGEGRYRETAAIGLGVFIGCSPFYGFHLLLCWLLALLFRLNRLKVYLAANVSNPILAPFLLFVELQAGSWLRTGEVHSLDLATLTSVSAWRFGLDLVVGWVAVGAILAALTAALTYAAVSGESRDPWFAKLARQASDRYVGQSMTGWEFARAKLRSDPIYREVLGGGLLPSGATLVDVGCGQGLMLALFVEAREAVQASSWPAVRRSPPLFDRLVGVETRPRVARLARSALGTDVELIEGDARTLAAEPSSAVLLIDVLHMMSGEAQESLLTSVTATLAPDGLILVREADASAGWRFALVRCVNRAKALLLGSWRQQFCYRSVDEWRACFAVLGFDAKLCPMPGGGTLGNVLFRVARQGPLSTARATDS